VAATRGDPELVEVIPITPRRELQRTVVMRLGPGRRSLWSLPDLRGGDALRVVAEIEVTTDSPVRRGRVGRGYDFHPLVEASLVLAGGPGVTAAQGRGALPVGEVLRSEVTHGHHRTIVFDETVRVPDDGLPWAGRSWVNLVLSAHHPAAEPGQVLLVGENEPDGTVLGNKGRIAAVRLRGGRTPARPIAEAKPRTDGIPVQKGERTVVCSLRIPDPASGEQFAVRARMRTSAAHLGYPARVSSRLFLADGPEQREPGGRATRVAAFRGVITPSNGFNCLPERDGCTTTKVGVAALRRPPRRDLYVNLVAVSADPFGGARRSDAVEVIQGLIEAVRYAPELRG